MVYDARENELFCAQLKAFLNDIAELRKKKDKKWVQKSNFIAN
jgi:hypothetical protein